MFLTNIQKSFLPFTHSGDYDAKSPNIPIKLVSFTIKLLKNLAFDPRPSNPTNTDKLNSEPSRVRELIVHHSEYSPCF